MGNYQDLTGKRHERLVVTGPAPRPIGKTSGNYWYVKCDCGKELILSSSEFNRKTRYSCGCYARERASLSAYYQHLKHGKTGTRLYGIWCAMIRRCENEACKEYPLYGGRGIAVCEQWRNDYSSFEAWAIEHGYNNGAPRGQCTIDRKDVNGNYNPENCRIVSQKEQTRNKRNNRFLTYKGETKTVSEWAEIYGMNPATLYSRLSYGWEIERCLTQPLRHW